MHPPDLVIRGATPSDLPGITEVENLSFVHAGERFTQKRVHYLILNPRCLVKAAEAEGRILGWAAGLVWLRGGEPWGRVYALAVHPDSRGRKLGLRLLNDMMQSLSLRGAGRLFLEVRIDNQQAIRLYESVGFKACCNLKDYYGPGLPGQRMEFAPRAG